MRTIHQVTITNPTTGFGFSERTPDPYRAEGLAINMTRRGYVCSSKIVRARKYEISIEEYRDGKRSQSIDY